MQREDLVKLIFKKRLEYKSWVTISKELKEEFGLSHTEGAVKHILKDERNRHIVGDNQFYETRRVRLIRVPNEVMKTMFSKVIERKPYQIISKELEQQGRYYSDYIIEGVIKNKKNLHIVGEAEFNKANSVKPILVTDVITKVIFQKRAEGKTMNKIVAELKELDLQYKLKDISEILKDESNISIVGEELYNKIKK